jgi:hypothetical protein
MVLDTKTYWLTDRQSQCGSNFDLKLTNKLLEYSGKLEEYSKQAVGLRNIV